jgi:cytochrome P450
MNDRIGLRPADAAPRIRGHWLTGSLQPYLRAPLEFYRRCAQSYGDIAFGRFLHFPVCVLSHPRYVEELLVQGAQNLEQSRFLRAPLKPLLGEGLLIAGAESHARQRPLAEKAVRGGIAAAWTEELVGAAEKFAASWTDGESRDLYTEMLRLISELLAGAAFGAAPHAFEASALVNRAVDLVTDRMQQFPPIPDFVPTRANLQVRRSLREMDMALPEMIRNARAASAGKGGLLAAMVAARGEDGGQLTDREVRDQIVMIHVAVRQNMAAVLTWTFYLLCQNEQSFAKVSHEVQAVVGTRRPGLAEAERLTYCDFVVKETLRLYPSVWQVLRHVARDTKVGGHLIRAGTQALMSQWVLHRDPQFFDDPEKFIPERWEHPREEWKLAYFPFGMGPRGCFGERLTFLTVKLMLAVLTRASRLQLVPGQDVKPLPAFALRPGGCVLMEIRRSIAHGVCE